MEKVLLVDDDNSIKHQIELNDFYLGDDFSRIVKSIKSKNYLVTYNNFLNDYEKIQKDLELCDITYKDFYKFLEIVTRDDSIISKIDYKSEKTDCPFENIIYFRDGLEVFYLREKPVGIEVQSYLC